MHLGVLVFISVICRLDLKAQEAVEENAKLKNRIAGTFVVYYDS